MKENSPYFKGNINSNDMANAIRFMIESEISKLGHPVLVRVEAFKADGITGRVDVSPLVTQADANGVPYPHGVIYGVPFLRIQGGESAIIIDPKPGDIGFIVISGRDHSHVLKTQATAPPASRRLFSFADCVYLGGFLNAPPTEYIQFTGEGITIKTSGKITIEAAEIEASCDIKANGISLTQHIHSGVKAGGDETGAPK